MTTVPQQPNVQDEVLSNLNAAIGDLNLARERVNVIPARDVFDSASLLVTMIRDSMVRRGDCAELGLFCADVCRALDRGMNGRQEVELSQPALEAIEQLATMIAGLRRNIVRLGRRGAICRFVHRKSDKRRIAAWRLDLNGILQVFEIELASHTHADVSDTPRDMSNAPHDVSNTTTITSDTHRDTLKNPAEDADGQDQAAFASAPGEITPPLTGNTEGAGSDIRINVVRNRTMIGIQRDLSNTQTMVSEILRAVKASPKGGNDGKNGSTQEGITGEFPPQPPRVIFGREGLIENIVGHAKDLTPVALIGPGGIGKTSIALTVLHDESIKERFGGNRRFIRCDQFPASVTLAHFLRRISEVIGARVKNPESLTPLHPFLSSREMLIVLDNAESILDPKLPNAHEIYEVVEELSRFSNIWLCITSRISTIPPDYKTFEIPTLWMDPARDAFYHTYQRSERSPSVDDILKQLDFHPLSIKLLATVAHHNRWDTDRLLKKWGEGRTSVLETEYANKGLAATIELSLASPMFQELGPNARELLGVVAFFPQGINEDNSALFFPTTPEGAKILDKFCILSLTQRNGGFTTMLAPLRDYLSPKDPTSSPLLLETKKRYFTRMSVDLDNPNVPGFKEARWIEAEDLNVEHLLDVFTSIDANSDDVWEACADFMRHIFWHKKRLISLGPKLEALPENQRSKPECLFELSQVFSSVGNHGKKKELLLQALKLWRDRKDGYREVQMLIFLAYANRQQGLYGEGVSQAKEAAETCERLGVTSLKAHSLRCLAWLLRDDKQFDAAKVAASRAIDAHTERGEKYMVCQCYRILAIVCHHKKEIEEAIGHFKTALGIASASGWHRELFWNHYSLAELFFDEKKFGDAHLHVKHAKSHAADDLYHLGRGTQLEATFFHKQQKFEEAKSRVSGAIEIFEKIGTTFELEKCRNLLQDIQKEPNDPVTAHDLEGDGRGKSDPQG